MSKFVERLQSLSKSANAPIGFHRSALEAKTPAMLLIAGLSGAQAREAQTASEVSPDAALILDQAPAVDVVKQMVAAAGDVPLGILLKGANEERASELAGSGCDFVVFDIKTAAAVLQQEEIGRLLVLEPSSDQGLVRAINSLEIDAVLIGAGEGDHAVSVEHLLIVRRFVELLEKPVMVTLPSRTTRAELAALSQAGVEGVVAPPAPSVEGLTALKQTLAGLPRGAKRRRAKMGAMIPHYRGVGATEEEEDAEEDEV